MSDILNRYKMALVFIAILLVLKFAIVPWGTWVSGRTDSISYHRFTLNKLGDLDQRSAALTQMSDQLVTDYQNLLDVLATNSGSANIVLQRSLEAIAKRHGAEITNRLVKDAVVDPVPHLPAVYYFRGRPEALFAVLSDIESSVPKMLVSRATFNQSGSSRLNLVATVELSMYLQPQAEVAP